ncbi:50S ribosomal protein L25/general stress protein Ctc [Bacillus carboniphilus]|uniref:Large ribosomal subunit protein bL25 n=1 Tax=Bacillus carboniphilus TaxID=86663 RepID=A0ABN0VYT9_9BACI
MATHTLEAKKREISRNSTLRELRLKGNIPAIVYGGKVGNTPISISEADFIKTMREAGRNGVISLMIDGSSTNVILTDYQQDFIKNEVIHADFYAVDMSAEIDVEVQVTLVGDAPGVKDGGVMQQSTHALTVKAKPSEIPQTIEVDVTNLQVNETITVADLRSKATNYQITNEDELVIASILPPKQEEEIDSGEEQAEGIPEKEEGRETEPESTDE